MMYRMTGTCATEGCVSSSNKLAKGSFHAVCIRIVDDMPANLALIQMDVSINYPRAEILIHHFWPTASWHKPAH